MSATGSGWARLRQYLRELHYLLRGHWSRLPLVFAAILLVTALDLAAVILMAPFLALLMQSDPHATVSLPLGIQLRAADAPRLAIGILVLYLVKAWVGYAVQRVIAAYSEGLRRDLMLRLLHGLQTQSYERHLDETGGGMLNLVTNEVPIFTNGQVLTGLRLLTDGLIFVLLIGFLGVSHPEILLIFAVLLGLVFVLVNTVVRPRLQRNTELGVRALGAAMESVQQAMVAFREVRLYRREAFFRARLDQAARDILRAQVNNSAMSLVPRYTVELAVVGGMVIAYLVLSTRSVTDGLLPTLGTFAAAAVRLMPASTAVLAGWATFRATRSFATRLYQRMRQIDTDLEPESDVTGSHPPFASLHLERVGYRYPNTEREVLTDVELRIERGEVIGLIGPSGAGKSTLADVILGFLPITRGSIMVNGRPLPELAEAWRSMLAYIPQAVALVDDSIARNIALGQDDAEIDRAKLAAAIQSAQLADFVAGLPEGVETRVGERGVKLSGGQRQRVALARALYYDREFLVFDEATSALDDATEREVVASIRALHGQKTMLIIAHRYSTLRDCDRIYEVRDGRVRLLSASERDVLHV